jgi:selenocysteine lyase/cysteine desulfurase
MDTTAPASLRPHYTAFLRPGRILLTGHSHQAWPDVARGAIVEAFEDAAAHVDDKWGRAMQRGEAVRRAVSTRVGCRPEDVALAPNTHELGFRFLSAMPLERRHVVTTTGEFHSLARQLRRLAEAGVAVTAVPAEPVETLAERVAAAVRPDTAAVAMSTVLFGNAAVVPHVEAAVEAAAKVGAGCLLDAYHAFQVMPLDVSRWPTAFVLGGGYKYAQWGEGACWMRVPEGCTLRPVHTGWFSDFAGLEAGASAGPIGYGPDNAHRFAGSTYDPTSHYRAAAVADFFDAQGLDVPTLRGISLRQTGRILDGVTAGGLEVVSPRAAEARAGFVAVRVPGASEVVRALRARGVYVDARGDRLRLGPAPYLTDDELDAGVAALVEIARFAGSV